ncbi:MAG: hypothetical protein L3J17_01175 [Candidatus Jettenia sp.]|nr:MAG: hypothetical protein L3J17_01175 [Candidatus Jettenia sp.]
MIFKDVTRIFPGKTIGKEKGMPGVMLLKCLLPGDGIIRDKRFLRWQGNIIKHFYYGNGKNAKRLPAKFISMFRIYPFGGFGVKTNALIHSTCNCTIALII